MLINFIIVYNLFWCRHQYKKRNYDPVDYECIDKTDFWIAKEEDVELIDGDMLEALNGEDGVPILNDSHIQG